MKKIAVVLSLLAAVGTPAAAIMNVDGDASDWAGVLMNLDSQDRTNILDVMGWGVVVENNMAYFAQVLEYSMWDHFNYNETGMVWMNTWIDLDNSDSSGFGGWQMENFGWQDDGIDIGIEIGSRDYVHDPWTISLYYTNGADNNYQDCSGAFAFSADGKFLEWSAPISEMIAAAVANRSVDSTAYGTLNQSAAATGLWQVGTRIDGADGELGIWYAHNFQQIEGHEGLVDLPVLPGDVNLDGTVSSADYTIWADNYGMGDIWGQGDLNLDGSVTSADYTIWADNYGATASGALIPEPATMTLLGFGIFSLLRRKK